MTALAIMAGFAAGLFVGVLWMLDGQDRAVRHEAAELDREHPTITDAEWDRHVAEAIEHTQRVDLGRPETVLVPLYRALRSVPAQREAGE